MTDLHTHILPGIDDGAKDVETSIELLKMEHEQGVKQIVFTPHFNCDEMSIDDFLSRRSEAFKKLVAALPSEFEDEFIFKLGAEVYFSPNLQKIDLSKLLFEGTSYLLVELPFFQKPEFLKETLFEIMSHGITPIIAHIERYDYMLSDLSYVYELVESGVVIQTNSKALTSGNKLLLKMVKWNLIQVVASDAHSLHRRPVDLESGLLLVKDSKVLDWADEIFDNYELSGVSPYCPKKILGNWR